MYVLLLQSQTLTIVLTTHVLMVHRAWMESIAIGVTAQRDSLGRIVKRVGVPQRISSILKIILLFLCNLLSNINDCVNHSLDISSLHESLIFNIIIVINLDAKHITGKKDVD